MTSSSNLLGINPKLDKDQRVRFDGEYLLFDVRYLQKSWTTNLIIKEFHEKENHASETDYTFVALSARYYIIK